MGLRSRSDGDYRFVMKRPGPGTWSLIWIGSALIFNLAIWAFGTNERALEFLTAYLIEKSLSVDNLFVFFLLFQYFRVPSEYQRRVLLWGMAGAIVMRGIFIVLGIAVLERFHWVTYVFGLLLIISALRIGLGKPPTVHPKQSLITRVVKAVIPVTKEYHGSRFFIRRKGAITVTPLLMVLLFIESSDLVFAIDSIPAVLAVSQDPFIVYTSNMFAVMGLRSLYFVIVDWLSMFHYLNVGLCVILTFIGTKMLLSSVVPITNGVSLLIIFSVLLASVGMSMRLKNKLR